MLDQYPHVGSNMPTIDVLPMELSIELFVVLGKSSEPLFTVRNIQSTIESTLQLIIIHEFYKYDNSGK